MNVVEVNQVDLSLREEVPEDGAEVPPRVAPVAEGAAPHGPAQLGQDPPGPGAGLPRGNHPAPELGAQSPCISPGEVGSEHRDLERLVERPQQLESTEGTPRIRGKRDPWNNVENIHVERLAIPRRHWESCVPPAAAPRGTSARRSACRARPPDRSVR